MSDVLEQHFALHDYESRDQDRLEILVADEWIDVNSQFRSHTLETYPGGHSRLEVEARANGGVLGEVWVQTFWPGKWRIMRGYELLHEGVSS